jgi:hypothetical protein
MNERILELAEQAGIAVWGDAVYMYHPSDTLDSTVMTKFAELIVKECVQVARVGIEFGPSMEEAVYTYFGVEE